MAGPDSIQPLDLSIRHFVYQHFVAESRPPTVAETAQQFGLSQRAGQNAFERLHHGHFLFLKPGTSQILMANPLSAVPTQFKVWVDDKSYWANCAWDMLGIPAMVQQDATIEATYQDTQEKITVTVKDGRLQPTEGVVHFPLPVRRWYDDLVLT